MHPKSRFLASVLMLIFAVGIGLFLGNPRRAIALGPLPPIPSPTPISATTSAPSPQPTPIVNPSALNQPMPTIGTGQTVEKSIPVIITYGDGTQTHAEIARGIMLPIGIPAAQPVTVTLFLATGIPGTPVPIGLFDGGNFAPAAVPPTLPPTSLDPVLTPIDAVTILADQTVRFNFEAGAALGLYRVLVTIGPKQYLLQFFAVKPRPASGQLSLPTPSPTPILRPITTPPPDSQAHP